jgi:hypothetical protein
MDAACRMIIDQPLNGLGSGGVDLYGTRWKRLKKAYKPLIWKNRPRGSCETR